MANRFKSDGPTKAIVAGLRERGISVEYFKARTGSGNGGRPDLIVGWIGVNEWLEVKKPGEGLSEEQVLFAANWQGKKPKTVTSLEEALIAIGYPVQRKQN